MVSFQGDRNFLDQQLVLRLVTASSKLIKNVPSTFFSVSLFVRNFSCTYYYFVSFSYIDILPFDTANFLPVVNVKVPPKVGNIVAETMSVFTLEDE